MEALLIRPVSLGDAPAIAAILRRMGWFEHLADLPPERHAEQIDRAIKAFRQGADQTALVAELRTAGIVGYASAHWRTCFFLPQGEGYLSELFVEARYRGQGIGSRLVDMVIREARRRGCARLVVTHNRHRESYQRGFYRCRGWQERSEMAQSIYPLWSVPNEEIPKIAHS